MSIMLKSRTAVLLERMQAQIEEQQRQINILVSYFAALPQPPRSRWERHTFELVDSNATLPAAVVDPALLETHVLPSREPVLRALPRRIVRVTLDKNTKDQKVTAYDVNDKEIEEFSGPFREVFREIIKREPRLKWQMVSTSVSA